MSSAALYENIRDANLARLAAGQVELDGTLAAGRPDTRRGVSLVIGVRGLTDAYAALVQRFRSVDPQQYYYPENDLHVTVFDFLTARNGYAENAELERAYLDLARDAARETPPFRLRLAGVVFSAAAGLIKGYDDDQLVALRARIRACMAERGLPIDERYASRSAHASFARFRNPPLDPARLMETIRASEETGLGELQVDSLELVEHDWYNAAASRRAIGDLALAARPYGRAQAAL